jgi:molecular chaperone DnaJ
MPKDFYQILGVAKGASDDEIKKSFRRLAHEHHPDKGGDPAKFKDINEAYQVLSNKEKRKVYDQFGSAAFEQGGAPGGPSGFGGFDFGGFQQGDFGDLNDILGEMFGMGGARGGRKASGRDIQVDVDMSFKEAAFGLDRSIRLYRNATCTECKGNGAAHGAKSVSCKQCHGSGQVKQAQRTMFGTIQTVVTCSDCHGRGQVPEKSCKLCDGTGVERRDETVTIQIPPGMESGQVLRVTGQGEAAPHGGRSGDLYLRIHVKPDTFFDRDGYDVLSTVAVPLTMLVLGGNLTVPTIDGDTELQISEGTQPGTIIKLRGKGIPSQRGPRGDQRVTVVAETPRRLTKEQRKLFDQLRDMGL